MKKFFLGFALLAWLVSGTEAFATVGFQSNGTAIGQATDVNCSTGLTCTNDGSTVTISGGAVGSDGNLTSDGLALTADLAPTKFIFTASSGDLAVTQLTASGLTASKALTTDGSKHLASSATTATELGYLSGLTTPTGTGAIVAANTPTLITPVIGAATGTSLTLSGALTTAGLTSSTTLTLQNSETIKNSTNGTVQLGSNASAAIVDVFAAGTSDDDASISLSADAAADNGDVWRITSDGGTDSILFENNTSGSQATKLTMTTTGIITTVNDIIIDGTTPQLTIGDVTGQASPIIMEGATADAYETTLAVVDPTADNTFTLPDASGSGMISTLTTNSLTAANSVWGASNGVVFEGATADAYETTLAAVDPTADQTVSIANAGVANALMFTTLTTNTIDAANSVWGISNGVVYEGATADAYETTVSPADPTADQTVTIPNFAVNYAYMGSTLTTNTVDAANSIWGVSNKLNFEGATADTSETSLTVTDPTADRTITMPDQTGTVMLAGAATALTPGAAVTLTVAPGNRLYTDTPTDNEDQTITFSGAGAAGDVVTIVFSSNTSGDEVITFHATLVSSTGTLTITATGSRFYTISFMSNGSHWYEISRTAVQT